MPGGHNPTNTNYLLSYQDDVEKVKESHPDWSPSQVNKEAAVGFRPKFRQDKKAFEKETGNLKEYEGPEFTIKNGDVYYPSYGRTLDELNTRTLELTPEQYSLAQHQTSAIIKEAFAGGAREVVTSYYRDGEDHRDLIVMRYDPETGIGKTIIINSAQDGKYHRFSEIQSVAKSKFTTHFETRPADNVFLLTDKPIRHDTARATVQKVALRQSEFLTSVKKGVITAGKAVAERAGTVVDQFMQRAKSNRLQDIPFLSRDSVLGKIVRNIPVLHENKWPIQPVREKRKVIKIPGREFYRKNVDVVKRPAGDGVVFRRVKAAEAVIGPAAKVSVEKSIARHERKVVKGKAKSEARRWVPAEKKLYAGRKKEKRLRLLRGKRAERAALFAEKRIVRRRIVGKESVRIRYKEKVIQLFTLVRKLIRRKERFAVVGRRKKDFLPRPKAEKKRTLREHVLDFSIAFVFWMVLVARYHKPFHDSKVEKRKGVTLKAKEKEPTPWLLLAIIWHLAMIREQGQAQQPVTQKKVKKKQSYARFAPQGVIFALAT